MNIENVQLGYSWQASNKAMQKRRAGKLSGASLETSTQLALILDVYTGIDGFARSEIRVPWSWGQRRRPMIGM